MRRRRAVAIPVIVALGIAAAVATSVATPPPAAYDLPVGWTTQFGTAGAEFFSSIARAPSGDFYVAGLTEGAFPGASNPSGNRDALLARFDKNGNRLWVHQFGTDQDEQVRDIVVSSAGDVYVVGSTRGDLDGAGPGPVGSEDAFIVRFDKNGVQKWIRQVGVPTTETGFSAAATYGSNAIYVAGAVGGDFDGGGSGSHAGSTDVLLVRFDRNGNQQWSRQIGASTVDEPIDIAMRGSSEVYVSGLTMGDLDGPGAGVHAGSGDAFVARWDSSGNLIWTRQFGTADWDEASAVTTNGSEVYVAGTTDDDLDGAGPDVPLGGFDAYLTRWDRNGNRIWTRQFGTDASDGANEIAVASSSAVYVVGATEGDIDGPGGAVALGEANLYLARFTNTGADVSVRMFGTPERENGPDMVLTSSKRPLVVAFTLGTVWGHANAGDADLFLAVLPS